MYRAHFGLQSRPFDISTDPTKIFVDGSRASFCDALRYVLEHERGFVKVTGAVGAGKTTLCHWLMRTLPSNRFRFVLLADPTLTAQQLDFALADAMGIEASREDPDRARVRLEAKFRSDAANQKQVVVLVDEAHAMPLATLERLRLFGQGLSSGNSALRIILLGPPELDRRLAEPAFAALRDRIVHSLRLRRLSYDDIHDYLQNRLRAAGYEGPRIFSANAVRLIGGLSRGLPRRINLLADKAMMSAVLEHRFEVRSRDVGAAAREIKLVRGRERETSPRLLSLAAGLGFAAGAFTTLALVLAAFYFGWVDVRSTQEGTSREIMSPSATVTPARR